jgi:RNA polymerase sigma-70 factor (ECF subfamily)
MLTVFHKTKEQMDSEQMQICKAQKNPKEFEPLYNQYFENIFRFVFQRVENKEEAADITSQVFLKAMLNIKSYQYKGVPFSAWLYRIAISEIGNYYQRTNKSRIVNTETEQIHSVINESGIDVTEERIQKILEALKNLSEDDLQLIEMRFFENRPFKEIGDILKITENNAKVKLYRTLDKIKVQLL